MIYTTLFKELRNLMRRDINTPLSCLGWQVLMIAGAVGLSLYVVSLSAAAQGCARTQPPDRPEMLKDVVYGVGYVAEEAGAEHTLQPLLMDVIEPANARNASSPGVVIIHGGGFERGSKEDARQVDLGHHLAGQGYVCFLINYRLARQYPPAPPPHADDMTRAVHAAVVDAKTALRHIRANRDRYRVDPDRIALVGSSAGAITALAAGLSPPDAFLNDGPDYPVPSENWPGVEISVAAIVNLWGSADFFPEFFNEQSPPIMTVHGGRDFRVGVSLLPALNIDTYCRQYGIPHVFYPLPEAGHGAWDAVVDGKPLEVLVAEFLAGYVSKAGG